MSQLIARLGFAVLHTADADVSISNTRNMRCGVRMWAKEPALRYYPYLYSFRGVAPSEPCELCG